jgi:hypothetical protein
MRCRCAVQYVSAKHSFFTLTSTHSCGLRGMNRTAHCATQPIQSLFYPRCCRKQLLACATRCGGASAHLSGVPAGILPGAPSRSASHPRQCQTSAGLFCAISMNSSLRRSCSQPPGRRSQSMLATRRGDPGLPSTPPRRPRAFPPGHRGTRHVRLRLSARPGPDLADVQE